MAFDKLRYYLQYGDDLRRYLPARRLQQLTRAWGFGNLVSGPVRRRRAARRLGFEPPWNVNISLTYRCNLKCSGCYASAYSRKHDMSAEDFDSLVQQAKALGVTMIGILGGEPLLRPDMWSVIARHRDVAFRLSTNGTLVDDAVVEALADNGHVLTFFSLEGLREQTDAWRGDGVFDAVMAAMERLREERILFGFAATLHNANKDVVASRPFFETLRAQGARVAAFFPYGPVGARTMPELVIAEPEVFRLMERIEELSAEAALIIATEGRASGPSSPFVILNSASCQAGTGVHVTPPGLVEPCNAIQFAAANALDSSLADALGAAFYRDMRKVVAAHGGRCVALYEPGAVLDCVQRAAAEGTNPTSMPCLAAHAQRCAGCGGRSASSTEEVAA